MHFEHSIKSSPSYCVIAERCVEAAEMRLVKAQSATALDVNLRMPGTYHLDMSLTPRPRGTEICFTNRWPAGHFREAGMLFMVPPGEEIRVRTEPCQLSILSCNLSATVLGDLLEHNFEWTDPHFEASADIANVEIRRLLFDLVDEIRTPGFASNLMVEAATLQLAVLLVRALRIASAPPTTGGLAQWQLRAIDDILEANEGLVTRSVLANACRLSVRQLSRSFSVSRGQSIGRYVSERRIGSAKQLLLSGNAIEAVANTLGFSSASNFCSAFRREVGCSPSQFRRKQS